LLFDISRGSILQKRDLWKLCETKTIRGYCEEQFLASRIAWTNHEYRLLLTRFSCAFFLFFNSEYNCKADIDIGTVKNVDVIFDYYVSIAIETLIDLVEVSIALYKKIHSKAKIYFGMINEFYVRVFNNNKNLYNVQYEKLILIILAYIKFILYN